MKNRSPIETLVDQVATEVLVYPEDKTETASKVLLQIADRAKKWWAGNRPYAYEENDHLQNPTINCRGEEEEWLARAVAEWIKMGG